MSLLLASVRDVVEAELALACGVDWIDIKDPAVGALGAASPDTVRDVVARIDGRRPVSATTGDCWHAPETIAARAALLADTGVGYVKAALAARDVGAAALAAIARAADQGVPLIVVCMAECAPRSRDLDALADCGIAGIMLDTADKRGPRLPELLDPAALAAFVAAARRRDLLCGLAGRLHLADIDVLAPLGADYLGFRSALCPAGQRVARMARAETSAAVARLARHGAADHSNIVAR